MKTTTTRICVDDKEKLIKIANITGINSSSAIIKLALIEFMKSKTYAKLSLKI